MLNYSIEEKVMRVKSDMNSKSICEKSHMEKDYKLSYLCYEATHPSNDVYRKVYEIFSIMDSYMVLNQEFAKVSRLVKDYISYDDMITLLVDYLLVTVGRTIAFETLSMNDNELTKNTIQVIFEGLCINAPLNHNSETQEKVNIQNLDNGYISFIVRGNLLKDRNIAPAYTVRFKITKPEEGHHNIMKIDAEIFSNIWFEPSYVISFKITLQNDIYVSNPYSI